MRKDEDEIEEEIEVEEEVEIEDEEEIEEMTEEVKSILSEAKEGLNKDSIAAIICMHREMDLMEAMIDSIISGRVWAKYMGDADSEKWDLDSFEFHLTELIPRNEKIYKYEGFKRDIGINQIIDINRKTKVENLMVKLPCLICLHHFLEAGMKNEDAIELFNRYFPEAEINLDDCDFVRHRIGQTIDKQTEKELEDEARKIVEIMKKSLKR